MGLSNGVKPFNLILPLRKAIQPSNSSVSCFSCLIIFMEGDCGRLHP